MSLDDKIYAAAKTLSLNLECEIEKLKDVNQLQDFEQRTKSLTALSKAVQTFDNFVRELKSNSKEDNGSIGSVVEFREELAQRIGALVTIAVAGPQESSHTTDAVPV